MKVYFPSWFDIKLNSKLTEAAVIHFRMLKRMNQFCYKQARDIALKTLVRNGFAAHPESIFLLMLADSNEAV